MPNTPTTTTTALLQRPSIRPSTSGAASAAPVNNGSSGTGSHAGRNVHSHPGTGVISRVGNEPSLPDVCKKFSNYLMNGTVFTVWGLGSVAAACMYPPTAIATLLLTCKMVHIARQGIFNVFPSQETVEPAIEITMENGSTYSYTAIPESNS